MQFHQVASPVGQVLEALNFIAGKAAWLIVGQTQAAYQMLLNENGNTNIAANTQSDRQMRLEFFGNLLQILDENLFSGYRQGQAAEGIINEQALMPLT